MTDRQAEQTGPIDILAELEARLDEVTETNPRIDTVDVESPRDTADLRAMLEVSLAINSSLVLDDVLQIVMTKAIELMRAERGLIMLLDEDDELQIRSAYNLCQDEMMDEDFRISTSITSEVASSGNSVYTSDALSDERFAKQRSVVELHLRSIMCVPLKVKEKVIGVIYLDNSSETRMFLKSDLFLFELYAQMVSNALHNAGLYQSLLDTQQYSEKVIETAPFGTVVVDSRGRIITINSVALEILDFNKDAVAEVDDSGRRVRFVDLLDDDERGRWQHMVNTASTTREEFSDDRYFHNTGYLEKALSIKIVPISNLPNDGDGVIIAIEDITEKVLMEKYVILSEKLVAKGEMAASIAHELNNYLAIASNNAELLIINVDRDNLDKAKFNAKAVTENVHKVKRFVDNLMDFSRPQSEFINYDIRHLIEDLLFSLRVQPRFKRTNFSIDFDSESPNIEMDVGQIQQVLMNLLNNAADAIEERIVNSGDDTAKFERKLSIVTSYDKESEKLTIKVSDNGLGMTEDTLSKVFSLHFTTKKGGHGLGLANCKKIIEQHHGELLCESTLGEGTTFTVTIPRIHSTTAKKTQ
ncbi:MAG: GAF domain-containing protein [candidate division Zixibacteria bacterium]|nr:GAF domain-containing protein [candidate division Zixibacteria bacterium]